MLGPTHFCQDAQSASVQHSAALGTLHTPLAHSANGPHSVFELQHIELGGGAGPSHQPVVPPQSHIVPQGQLHAPTHAVPGQSLSPQHCIGGGLATQFPSTHSMPMLCPQSASVLQQLGLTPHLPRTCV